jgi:hypothetical protein
MVMLQCQGLLDNIDSRYAIVKSILTMRDSHFPHRLWLRAKRSGQTWPCVFLRNGRAATVTVDARAGGCFCEIARDRLAQHMQVVFAEPERMLRMIGGLGPLQGMGLSGVLEWRITAADGGGRYRSGLATRRAGQLSAKHSREPQ